MPHTDPGTGTDPRPDTRAGTGTRTGADATGTDAGAGTDAQSRRAPGGPYLQDELTEALTRAFFEELAGVGYGRLSLEAVARRASAGKAAIYRRWPSKRAMTVALVSAAATTSVPSPDTGTLRGDLLHFLADAANALAHPLVSRIVPDLLSEATRDPELAEALIASIRGPRREAAALMFQRAAARGEIPADTDTETALDFLVGPLYWRVAVTHMPVDDTYLGALATKIIRTLGP
ncbi:TetR/AcrR family transcriptional regulator [Streptomyces tremellae]|uniref:TetR/AcrR family transcriptional regulator n=1 Tax=Streptomyces tremellae TaxID=1124239 RepID=A0ABP7F6X9_9ACTN